MSHAIRPSWWVFYLIAVLMAALLVWGAFIPVSHHWHEALLIGIVVCGHSLLGWWLHANRQARRCEEEDRTIERSLSSQRDLPLSAIQARYLDRLERTSIVTALRGQAQRR